MEINKALVLENICYTELVYARINKKLKLQATKPEIEALIYDIIDATPIHDFQKIGKNYYVSNLVQKIKVTINSNTFRIITLDRIK